jgi:hypothetical protein
LPPRALSLPFGAVYPAAAATAARLISLPLPLADFNFQGSWPSLAPALLWLADLLISSTISICLIAAAAVACCITIPVGCNLFQGCCCAEFFDLHLCSHTLPSLSVSLLRSLLSSSSTPLPPLLLSQHSPLTPLSLHPPSPCFAPRSIPVGNRLSTRQVVASIPTVVPSDKAAG